MNVLVAVLRVSRRRLQRLVLIGCQESEDLLVVGLVSSERIDSNPGAFSPGSEMPQTMLANVPSQSARSFLDYGRASGETGSVVTAQSHSIFQDIQNPRVQNVNFSVPLPSN